MYSVQIHPKEEKKRKFVKLRINSTLKSMNLTYLKSMCMYLLFTQNSHILLIRKIVYVCIEMILFYILLESIIYNLKFMVKLYTMAHFNRQVESCVIKIFKISGIQK